jgi:quinoprotein glucose dehydrogenase
MNDMQKQNLSILKIFAATAMLLAAGCKSREDNDRTWSVYKADANSSSYSH